MNNLQYLLNKLSQEAAELIQEATKASEFGLDNANPATREVNRAALHKELHDLLAVVDMLNREEDFGFEVCFEKLNAKLAKVTMFREISRHLGFVAKR